MNRPTFDGKSESQVRPLYEQIQNGMTRQEVTALLGKPHFIWNDAQYQSSGSVEFWRYGGGAQYVDIYFSPEGKVVEKYLGS